jgi:WD40 repeat protein
MMLKMLKSLCLMLFLSQVFALHVEAGYEPVVQFGHSDNIQAVAIHPSGKFIVSGAWDGTVKVWDFKSGRLLRVLSDHASNFVSDVVIDPDGKYIVASIGNEIKVWDFESSILLRAMKTGRYNYNVTSMAISPEGRYIVSSWNDRKIRLWELESGALLKTLEGHSEGITSVAVDPTGRFIASGDKDRTVRVWDIKSGNLLRTLNGHAHQVFAVAIDPTGQYVVSSSGTVIVWDLESGKLLRQLEVHDTPNNEISTVAIDPTGRFIITGRVDKTIRVWHLQSGTLLKTIKVPSSTVNQIVHDIAVDPTGRYFVSGGWDFTVKIWDLSSGELLRNIRGNKGLPHAVAVDPGGRFIVWGTERGTIKVWDLKTLKMLRTLKGHTHVVGHLAIDSTGQFLASSSWDNTVKVWRLRTGELLNTLKGHSNVLSVTIDPSGRFVISGSRDNTIKVWGLESGKLLRTLKGHSAPVYSVVVDPTGRFIVSGSGDLVSGDGTIKIWDLETGNVMKTLKTNVVFAMDIDPSGRFIASGGSGKYKKGKNNKIRMWDIETGELVNSVEAHSGIIRGIKVDKTGQFIVSGSDDKTVKVWDFRSGRLIKTLKGHSQMVHSAALDPTGRFIVSGSRDGTTKIWNVKTGKHVTLLNAEDDWLIFTEEGYFDSSLNGSDLIAMVEGLDAFGVDQFAIKYNRPDIILKYIGLGSDSIVNLFYGLYQKRLKDAGFTEEQLSDEMHVPDSNIIDVNQDGKHALLKFKVSDDKYNLKKYNIYVNDIPLYGAYGKNISGRSAVLSERVDLGSGNNKIEVSCINEKGVESYRALTYANYNKHTKGDLYYIGFGISRYKDGSLNLQYADKDALDLANLFSNMNGYFDKVHIQTYVNEEVTTENIKSSKAFLKSAAVDDTVVVFIAGHGLHDSDEDATYYYLMHDTDIDNLADTAAPYEQIEDILQVIAPRKKLLLMDTCESGEVEADMQEEYFEVANSRGFRPRTTRAIRARFSRIGKPLVLSRDRFIHNDLMRRSGSIVFSSSRGGEFSYESEELENGFFTEEIIKSLTSKRADKDGDGVLSTDELRQHVILSVSSQTRNMQHPTVDRDNIYQKFSFPLITARGTAGTQEEPLFHKIRKRLQKSMEKLLDF